MKFAYQIESQQIHWPMVFSVLSMSISYRFYKHVHSKKAPKTRGIINIDILFSLNNTHMIVCLHFMQCLLHLGVFCLLQNRALDTLNVIGHCIVWFLFDMHISLRLKIQSLSLLWSSCENFRPLDEAKCHAVWKMIVIEALCSNEKFQVIKNTLGHQTKEPVTWRKP